MIRYFILNLKRNIVMAAGCLAATTVLLSVFFCGIFFYQKNVSETDALVKLGVCVDEQDEMFTKLIRFVGKNSSLKNICSLSMTGQEEALSQLDRGELDMVMVVPPDFISKADTMQETSFTVFVPENSSGNVDTILSLFKAVEGMMTVTEDGILTMYEGIEKYSVNVSVTDMENDVTGMFVDSFLQRRRSVDLVYISAFGDYDFSEYYVCTIILLMILLFSFSFLKIYDKGHGETERILFRGAPKRMLCHLGKIMAVSIPLWMVMAATVFGLDVICMLLGSSFVMADMSSYFMLLPVGIGIGITIHLIGCLFRGKDSFMGYAGAVILLLTLSGLIFPECYFPVWLRGFAHISPVFRWHKFLLMALF